MPTTPSRSSAPLTDEERAAALRALGADLDRLIPEGGAPRRSRRRGRPAEAG